MLLIRWFYAFKFNKTSRLSGEMPCNHTSTYIIQGRYLTLIFGEIIFYCIIKVNFVESLYVFTKP